MLRTRLSNGAHFGLGHVVDVLRGKLTPKVAQFSHDRLKTFGIGADLSDTTWRGWRSNWWRAARSTSPSRTMVSWCRPMPRGRS